MFRFGKRNNLSAALLLLMTTAFQACSEKIEAPELRTIDVAIQASIGAPGQATQVSRYVLTVSGPGILEPIVAELYYSNGFLTCSIVVPAGPSRLFRIEGLDRTGTVIYSGETLADVETGSEFVLSVDLYPRIPMIKVSPMNLETIQGDLLAMKIRVYKLADISQLFVGLTNTRIQGESYLYYDSIIVNPYLEEVASVESWGGEGPEVYVQMELKDPELRIVDGDGYVEIATVYYKTGMYEISPYETVVFTPSLIYMIDKEGNQLPVESVLVENATTLLYDYWYRQIADWRMEARVNPSEIYDGSGNFLHGTARGTEVVDGFYGAARSFNGKSDYIAVPDHVLLDFQEEITISMWVNLGGYGRTSLSSLVCKSSGDGPINYQLMIEDNSDEDDYATVYFRYGNAAYHIYRADIPDRLMDGWFRLVFSYRFGDPSSALFAAGYCYYPEKLPGAWETGNGREPAPDTDGDLFIGRDASLTHFFGGMLDEMELSDMAWSMEVIYYNEYDCMR